MPLRALVGLVRPHQWYKNLVVFIALIFSRNFLEPTLWRPALVTFVAFCLLSGSVYAWNDVVDAARDRQHPKKRHRPVASGLVSTGTALALGALAAAAGLGLLRLTNVPTLTIGVTFLAFQVLYNALLKHQVIWDVLLIGAGFVLRALAGTTAIQVQATVWLILCTFLLALFLAFGKRRHELRLMRADTEGAARHRPVLGEYSLELVDTMTNIVAALLLASYILYTALGNDPWMMFTIPFALFGVFRYLYLVQRRDHGDEPELVFRDWPTLSNAAAWTAAAVLVLLGVPQRILAWLQAL